MSTTLATVSPTLHSSCNGRSFILKWLCCQYFGLLIESLFFRLLGPSAAADILQLSNSLPLQSRGRARLLVGNEDVHIIARSDDELLDDFFHEQSSTGGQAGE